MAKEMLRYLDKSEKVKVGVAELQERLRYLYKSVFLFSKWPSRRGVKMAKRFSKYFGKKKKRSMLPAGPDAQWKGSVELDMSREIRMLSKRQEIFKNAIEGKLRMQSRASERLQDQIIEEIKEMEHKRTEEALELTRKE